MEMTRERQAVTGAVTVAVTKAKEMKIHSLLDHSRRSHRHQTQQLGRCCKAGRPCASMAQLEVDTAAVARLRRRRERTATVARW